MKTIYKVFIVIFVIFCGFNLYQIDWKLGATHVENAKFWVSFLAGIAGIILVFVIDAWSRLASKK